MFCGMVQILAWSAHPGSRKRAAGAAAHRLLFIVLPAEASLADASRSPARTTIRNARTFGREVFRR